MSVSIRKGCLGIAILLLCLVMTACGQAAPSKSSAPTPRAHVNNQSNDVSHLNWRVPEFRYTDQNGRAFGLSQLKGKVWLANLIFTRCPDICPPMTSNMARVQKALNQAGLKADIVSFSVDPSYDKPDKLRAFAEEHGAKTDNWHFLTGYSDEEIRKFAQSAFKQDLMRSETNGTVMVSHTARFYLIGPDGRVMKIYDGLRPDEKAIVNDIRQLQK
ncbi:cysteine ABC transporter ATP-binding protein [Polycladomyces abyssicola]|uniref:Cysteine ABC transporter ATP-binding protein n=1 Tax=Polycladomyces abyssicola TaxID=1125966 RepID=A0A8D5ZM43_9BACL|nr:SCO family protein [Polycladomyces abyssicola]BCU81255.1 cysteine ABC transporter ATP-binding protein [Polycladomyces abyssicola]